MFGIILKLLGENVYQVSFTGALYEVEEFFTHQHWVSIFQLPLQDLVTSASGFAGYITIQLLAMCFLMVIPDEQWIIGEFLEAISLPC